VVNAVSHPKSVLTFRNFSLRCDKTDPKISFETPWNWKLPQGKRVAVISENSFLRYQLITSLAGLIPPVSGEIACSGVIGWPVGGEGGLDSKMRVCHALDFLSSIYGDCLERSLIGMDRFWELLSGMEIYPTEIIRDLTNLQKDFFFLSLSVLFTFDFYLIPQTRFLMSKDASSLRILLLKQLEGKSFFTTSTNRRFQKDFCTDGLVLGSLGEVLFAGSLSEAIEWSEKNIQTPSASDAEEEEFEIDSMFSNSESADESMEVEV